MSVPRCCPHTAEGTVQHYKPEQLCLSLVPNPWKISPLQINARNSGVLFHPRSVPKIHLPCPTGTYFNQLQFMSITRSIALGLKLSPPVVPVPSIPHQLGYPYRARNRVFYRSCNYSLVVQGTASLIRTIATPMLR